MEGIIHIRIDDRLIHGQVATQWTNDLGATRIMAINDEVATNPTLKPYFVWLHHRMSVHRSLQEKPQ